MKPSVRRSPASDVACFKRVAGIGDSWIDTLSARYVRQCFTPHAHAEYLFGVIEAGCHMVRCNGVDTPAAAGTLVTMNPGDVHSGGSFDESGWLQHMVYVEESAIDSFAEDIFDRSMRKRPVLEGTFRQPGAFVSSFLATYRVLRHNSEPLAAQSAALRLVEGVLARFAGATGPAARSAPHAVRRMTDFIEAHLGRSITLDVLASVGGLRRRHTIELFQQTYGVPPHRYLIVARIEAVKTLLRSGVTPAHAASACGFADQSHMSRHFRSIVGTTPARYAEAMRG